MERRSLLPMKGHHANAIMQQERLEEKGLEKIAVPEEYLGLLLLLLLFVSKTTKTVKTDIQL